MNTLSVFLVSLNYACAVCYTQKNREKQIVLPSYVTSLRIRV